MCFQHWGWQQLGLHLLLLLVTLTYAASADSTESNVPHWRDRIFVPA
jgi:hypothetical protein